MVFVPDLPVLKIKKMFFSLTCSNIAGVSTLIGE
jgi:hypothetical protein